MQFNKGWSRRRACNIDDLYHSNCATPTEGHQQLRFTMVQWQVAVWMSPTKSSKSGGALVWCVRGVVGGICQTCSDYAKVPPYRTVQVHHTTLESLKLQRSPTRSNRMIYVWSKNTGFYLIILGPLIYLIIFSLLEVVVWIAVNFF